MIDTSKNIFNSIICLNGNIPDEKFFYKYKNLPIIAADGAGKQLILKGVKPDFIVGDFDSCDLDSMQYQDICFIEHKNQDYNDFEKSILEAKKRALFPALICGMFGKEVDHMLNNVNCFMKHNHKCHMIFYDKDSDGLIKWGFSLSFLNKNHSLSFIGIKDELVSILPHPEAIISSRGLKWDMQEQKLSINGMSGIRNKASGDNVYIQIHAGRVLLITSRNIYENSLF